MKKIFVALVAVAMTAGFAANAANDKKCDKQCEAAKCEQKACPKERANCPEMREFAGLDLTDAQKDQLKALNAQRFADAKKAKEARKAEKNAKAQARRDDRQQYLNQVKGILTPEQYTKYLENQLKREKGPKQHMQKPGGRQMKEGQAKKQFKGQAERAQKAVEVEK